jgi:hypothetical protein
MWKFKLVGIILTLFSSIFILNSSVLAQSAPGTPSNVLVSYPVCEGENCNFSQAKCTWGSASDAASYTVVIREVDTNTIIQNQSVSASTLTYTFPVTSGRTYECTVTAVSSSGQSGTSGSHSLLCQTDEIGAPIVTAPPAVPLPPPPAAGNEFIFMAIGFVGAAIILIGATVIFVL